MQELPSLKETVEKYQLLAKKSLGQNFLLDMNITEKIIRLSLTAQNKSDFKDECVYEIGPGPGGLTRAVLAANPAQLTVIEMDERCIRIMNDIKEVVGDKLRIVEGDALKYDFTEPSMWPKNIVSNLPYNISVPLLISWLKNANLYKSMTLMFQKEVAERITAEIGTKDYGRLSVLAQLTCNIKTLFSLSPSCFVPAPKIWSTVLLFQPLQQVPSADVLSKVEKLTTMAFGQRRKMIRQSLKQIPNITDICVALDVDMTCRAENLTPEQYLQIAQRLYFF